MSRSARRALVVAVIASSALFCACNALTGIGSLERGSDEECLDESAVCTNPDADLEDGGSDRASEAEVDPACGKDCLGGACSGTTCQPVVLATGQNHPVGIAVDAKRIYWANRGAIDAGNGSVQTALLDGKDPKELVKNQPSAGFVVLDDTWVYLSGQGTEQAAFADGRIVRIKKDGTGFDRIYDNQLAPLGIAIDTTSVYWTNALNGEIFKARLDGTGTPTQLAPALPYSFGIAVDGQGVYWTRYDPVDMLGEIYAAQIDGGGREAIVMDQKTPRGIALDARHVYWVNEDDNNVMSVPRAGAATATPKVLAEGQDAPYTIALDDKFVYWVNQGATDGTGSIMRIGKNGTCPPRAGTGDAAAECPEVLASRQSRPYGIAVDGVAVYWVNFSSGDVLRVAK